MHQLLEQMNWELGMRKMSTTSGFNAGSTALSRHHHEVLVLVCLCFRWSSAFWRHGTETRFRFGPTQSDITVDGRVPKTGLSRNSNENEIKANSFHGVSTIFPVKLPLLCSVLSSWSL